MLVKGHADHHHWGRRLMASALDNETAEKNCTEPGTFLKINYHLNCSVDLSVIVRLHKEM